MLTKLQLRRGYAADKSKLSLRSRRSWLEYDLLRLLAVADGVSVIKYILTTNTHPFEFGAPYPHQQIISCEIPNNYVVVTAQY